MAQAGLGWAGLGLGLSPGFIAHDLPTACAAFVIVPVFTGSLLAAQTWRGVPHAPCAVSTSFIARDLPTACAGALWPLTG